MSDQKSIVAQPPGSFSEAELEDFIAMVRAGGEVGDTVLEQNIRSAKRLVFLRQGGCLRGIAALKNPLLSYREKIEEKTSIELKASQFPFELGYVFVLPSARRQGLSMELTDAALLASEGKGVFATSRTDNDGMHVTLGKFSFVKAGPTYKSRDGTHNIQLFLRPAAQLVAPADAPNNGALLS